MLASFRSLVRNTRIYSKKGLIGANVLILFLMFNDNNKFSTQSDPAAQSNVVEVDSIDVYNQYFKGKHPLVLDFYASWCNPCKKLTPLLVSKANSPNQKWKLLKINIDDQEQLSSNYQIQSVPTVMLFHEGKLIDKFVGIPPEAKIDAFINKANDLVK